jgi:hypothetical protein
MRTPTLVVAALAGAGMLSLSAPSFAHVEYYDLNQGRRIGDLTAAGKIKSTQQYGSTPAAVLALDNSAANGLGGLSSQSAMALNNPEYWNGTYQSYISAGTFSNLSYNAATGSGTAHLVVNDVTDAGWGAGTQARLGDSHRVGFFNFRLASAQEVTITWNVDTGDGVFIDSAFSLYRGVLPYQGHDDAVEKLNPKTGLTTRVQDALDSRTAPVDVQGIASSYRNTTATGPSSYNGQFNALGNWGQSNVSGNWSNIEFLTFANASNPADGYSLDGSDTLESLTIVLGPGNYTIAASGALGASIAAGGRGAESFGLTNLRGELTFSATALPVPEPGTWAMLASGLLLTGIAAARRRKADC